MDRNVKRIYRAFLQLKLEYVIKDNHICWIHHSISDTTNNILEDGVNGLLRNHLNTKHLRKIDE